MATYYVNSGGSNTSPYDTWAKAATTLATATAAATADGDIIKVHYTHQETSAANVTWTLGANVNVHVVDKDSSDAPAIMGTGGWVGGDSNFTHTLTSGTNTAHHVTGLTIRVGGASDRDITVGSSTADGCQWELEDCYFWIGNTNITTDLIFGNDNTEQFFLLTRPTFRFGATAQIIDVQARMEIESGSISTAGSVPTTIFAPVGAADVRKFDLQVTGTDLSHAGSGNLVADENAASGGRAVFRRCKLGASAVMLSTSQTTNSGLEVFVFDCASGDSHIQIGHQNALGSTVVDTGIYVTADAEALSWKVVSSANCTLTKPYSTPWIRRYNSDVTTSIQPWFEILRDGSATAYDDDEVWGSWAYKGTTGSTQATIVDDRMAVLGTPAAQANGTGTGNWTGEGGTAWSGKVQAPAAFTPAEVGDLRAKIVVGVASTTVYVSPRIRIA